MCYVTRDNLNLAVVIVYITTVHTSNECHPNVSLWVVGSEQSSIDFVSSDVLMSSEFKYIGSECAHLL